MKEKVKEGIKKDFLELKRVGKVLFGNYSCPKVEFDLSVLKKRKTK